MPPFESPNYTQAPNDLFDIHLKEMGLAELKVTLAVVRYTFGYHKETCKISIRKLSQLTGLSENGVIAGATAAEKRGLITKVTERRRTTNWIVNISSTSASEADLPQPVRQTASASEARLNKDKEKTTGGVKPKSEYVQTMEYLEKVFAQTRGVPIPDWEGGVNEAKRLQKTWRQPLSRMYKETGEDIHLTSKIIIAAVNRMKQENLTFSMPAQIEKVFSSLLADNKTHSQNERNITQERLAQA